MTIGDKIMATSVRSELGVRDLSKEYPATLPKRIEWLENGLGLDRERVLELAGVRAPTPSFQPLTEWEQLAAGDSDRLEEVEQILFSFVSQFCNDVAKARDFLDHVRQDAEFCTKHLPFLTRFSTPTEKDAALLGIIHEGGTDFIVALGAFLASGHGSRTSS
jgi:hypothetical protein